MRVVNHFGVHFTDSGVGYLVQQDDVQHVLDIPLDIEVTVRKPRRSFSCSHAISLQGATEAPCPDTPLVRAFLPLPKQPGDRPIFLKDTPENQRLVQQLLRLSSPTSTSATMIPLWLMKEGVISDYLRLTNIQPLVLFGFSGKLQSRLNKILEFSTLAERRLVVMLPDPFIRVRTDAIEPDVTDRDIIDLPLEGIGAQASQGLHGEPGVPTRF